MISFQILGSRSLTFLLHNTGAKLNFSKYLQLAFKSSEEKEKKNSSTWKVNEKSPVFRKKKKEEKKLVLFTLLFQIMGT